MLGMNTDEVYNGLERTFSEVAETLTRIRTERQTWKDMAERRGIQIHELIQERDTLKDAYVQASLTNRSGTPGTETKKSTKMADPEPLSDGQEPKYEQWLSRMKNKLEANADHYPTEVLKITYIESRTKGDAARHLEPRMRTDHPEKYQTAKDMFDHLDEIYLDPNRLMNAKTDFRRLIMKNSDKYQQFLTRFLHLAGEAQVPKNDYMEEFHQKLSFDMQSTVTTAFSISKTFDEFQKHCSKAAHTLEHINEVRDKQNSRKKNTNREPKTSLSATKPRAEGPKPNANADREKLMREGKCFYCKETGHLAHSCPLKNKPADLKPIEENSDDSVKEVA
jgi:hypothetical protein